MDLVAHAHKRLTEWSPKGSPPPFQTTPETAEIFSDVNDALTQAGKPELDHDAFGIVYQAVTRFRPGSRPLGMDGQPR